MNRRGFLLGMLALGAAPAIVRASSLMPLVMRRQPLGYPYWIWEGTIEEGSRLIIPNPSFSVGAAIGGLLVPLRPTHGPRLLNLVVPFERT